VFRKFYHKFESIAFIINLLFKTILNNYRIKELNIYFIKILEFLKLKEKIDDAV
jgi:hypothetical protein